MKKIKRITSILFAMIMSATMFVGCGDKADNNCKIFPVVYQDINTVQDVELYASQVDNMPVDNGVIISPYYTMKINGVDVPVYATRTANGAHSFAYVDVEVLNDQKDFKLNTEITVLTKSSVLKKSSPEVVVLPESHNIKASIKGDKVKATISKTGNFSFAFNKSHIEPLTLLVAPKQDFKTPEGYEVVYIEPGEYTTQTNFKTSNTVYYFKSGRYKIDCIYLPADSVLYLERGAYLEVMPNSFAVTRSLSADRVKNVTVTGRGLFDYSACTGSDMPGYSNNKSGLVFYQTDNILFEGVTIINSQTWTLCFYDCEEINVKNCMLFGYRTYSDGIMLSDCKNAIVEDCFVRTGDDAFETKSTTHTGYTDNVLFRNNAAWTDKAIAYGTIYESNQDTQNVKFQNCSVGFSLGTWSSHLGTCVVQMGNRPGAKMYNIHFEDIEVYTTYNALLNVFIGGSGGQGAGYGTVENIYFKNITAKRNFSYVLHLRAYDNVNCFINDLYLDNIVSNGEALTPDNCLTGNKIRIAADYDISKLHINTRA
jgi:hypothetical protein